MSTFKVPVEKTTEYPSELFNFLSSTMHEFAVQYRQWPDKISFTGRLGEELFNIIDEMEWDFSKFNMTSNRTSPVNNIIIEYTKPVKVSGEISQDGKPTYSRGESMDSITAGGIISGSDASKVIENSISKSFKIEKEVRPTIRVRLIR